jgi:hypothetical protein
VYARQRGGQARRRDMRGNRCGRRDDERWKDASGKLLQDRALGAIVVGRVQRAAGHRQVLGMSMLARMFVVRRRREAMAVEIDRDPRQRAGRRPRDRD